jgi:hypothetical protein
VFIIFFTIFFQISSFYIQKTTTQSICLQTIYKNICLFKLNKNKKIKYIILRLIINVISKIFFIYHFPKTFII